MARGEQAGGWVRGCGRVGGRGRGPPPGAATRTRERSTRTLSRGYTGWPRNSPSTGCFGYTASNTPCTQRQAKTSTWDGGVACCRRQRASHSPSSDSMQYRGWFRNAVFDVGSAAKAGAATQPTSTGNGAGNPCPCLSAPPARPHTYVLASWQFGGPFPRQVGVHPAQQAKPSARRQASRRPQQ